jgi:hypothetical protein
VQIQQAGSYERSGQTTSDPEPRAGNDRDRWGPVAAPPLFPGRASAAAPGPWSAASRRGPPRYLSGGGRLEHDRTRGLRPRGASVLPPPASGAGGRCRGRGGRAPGRWRDRWGAAADPGSPVVSGCGASSRGRSPTTAVGDDACRAMSQPGCRKRRFGVSRCEAGHSLRSRRCVRLSTFSARPAAGRAALAWGCRG